MGIAKEAAPRLGRRLETDLGSYLFGATLPDIHLISHLFREQTHFYDLARLPLGEGVEEFFRACPQLAEGSQLKGPSRALVAGYLSHLVADMVWIRDIYHPFFGPSSPLGGDPLADIKDRALQYELDRREREDSSRMAQMRQALAELPWEATVEFLAVDNLRLWHEFVLTATLRPANWERFPVFAERYLLRRGKVRPEELESFLKSPPSMVGQILEYVTPGKLREFRQKSVSRSVATAEEYLS